MDWGQLILEGEVYIPVFNWSEHVTYGGGLNSFCIPPFIPHGIQGGQHEGTDQNKNCLLSKIAVEGTLVVFPNGYGNTLVEKKALD